ncbi:uncharacterized protein [Amphiura filiformis]|uniref:uncharacterized protein n=1 Tax=Amphiura filiformis TaxID=82378 RepID=UPI003B21BD61
MPMDTCTITTPLQNMTMDNNNNHEMKPKMTSGRRSSKPLMEKRRRARINDSLTQLKSLILEATNKDSSRHSKLEKADILEMTVRYLRNMQRHQISGSPNGTVDLNRYRRGYSECLNEVNRYLESAESGVQLRTQLIGHLANRCSPPSSPGPQQQQQTVAFAPSPSPAPIVAAAMIPSSQHSTPVQVQVAPSSVTRSEIRVVLPPEALSNGQLPSHFIPVYAHAIPSPTSPTSSVETPSSPLSTTPPQQQTYELSSQISYEQHQQTVPMSYMQGVAPTTTSPMVACTAPSVARSPVTVQYASPDVHFSTATEIRMPTPPNSHELRHEATAPQQHHVYYQNGPNTLKSVVPQCIPSEENVWRPW